MKTGKNKKTYFLLLLVAVLIFGGQKFTAGAAENEDIEQFLIGTTQSGNGWTYDEETATLTISADDVECPFEHTLDNKDTKVKYLVFTNDVTSVKSGSFSNCSKLIDICFSESITNIGAWAFESCTSLTSVAIPPNVSSIEARLFACCYNLENVTIPEGVESIGGEAFAGCGLTEIDIPSSVKSIGSLSFSGCNFSDVNLPNGLESIGEGAFNQCDIKNIVIPNSVTSIGKSAFFSERIAVSSGNPLFDSRDNCNGIIETATNTLILGCKNTNIPSTVTCIGDSAFDGCRDLISISIPQNVKSIGSRAFAGTGLQNLVIPEGVTSIGAMAFQFSSIKDISIPNGVSSIGEAAFAGCNDLSSIVIPDGVTCISDDTFWSCSKLVDVTIPDSVKSIGYRAFMDCSSLKNIVIPNSVTEIKDWAFYGCDSITILGRLGSYAESYAKINHISFKVLEDDPYIGLNGYKLGRDNNSFCHSSYSGSKISGFVGVADYRVDNATYNRLVRHSNGAGDLASIKRMMDREWHGSCYGIAVTMSEVFANNLSVSDISSSFGNYFDMELPYKDSKLLNNIQYYQISQVLDYYAISDNSEEKVWPSMSKKTALANGYETSYRDFFKKVIDNSADGKTKIFSYSYYKNNDLYGHAILLTGVKKKKNGDYIIQLFDENSVDFNAPKGNFIDMTVSGDMTSFNFVDGNGNIIDNDNICEMGVVNPSALESLLRAENSYTEMKKSNDSLLIAAGNSDTCKLVFAANDSVEITNDSNRKLSYKDNQISGDMQISGIRMIHFTEEPLIEFQIDNSSGFKIFSNDPNMDFSIKSENDYVAVCGEGIDSAEVSLDRGLVIYGDSMDFQTYVGTSHAVGEKENGLICVSGKAEKSVIINELPKGVNVVSEKGIEDISVEALLGNEVVSKASGGTVMDDNFGDTKAENDAPKKMAFHDVPLDKWYYDAVKYVFSNDIMSGTSDNAFEPEGNCTREMFVQILYNMEGKPGAGSTNPFKDVMNGKWYYDAVTWAVANGVTTGTSVTTFGIGGNVTREQLAQFLMNYAQKRGFDTTARADVSKFPDNGQISGWAQEAISWANAKGIINGKKKDGTVIFDPRGNATRAEVAQMIMNFQKKFGK